MKVRVRWIVAAILCVGLIDGVTPLGEFTFVGQRHPNVEETNACGTIRDVIQRDSGRFRRILIRNTNNQVNYIDDDARRMTSRTKSKLDVLASLVINNWKGIINVRVTRAWTDQVIPSNPTSLHYEGRSVRLETSDGDRGKLGRLAGLAVEAGFDWVEYSNLHYIRASVIPDVCQTSVDLVFVLDNSGSVGNTNFQKVKEFVKRVVDFFNIGVDGTHVAVVTYDTNTHIEFKLNRYYTKNELRNAVDDIKYRGYLTYTGEALNTVRQQVLTTTAGMRDDVGIPKVLVLLTDGYSNGIKVLDPANQLRALGVSIFSIGVGPSVSQLELNAIASDPDTDYVFNLQSFNQLAGFVDRVSSVSCSEGSLINSCSTSETSVDSGSFKYFRTTFDVVTKDEVSVEIRDLIGVSHLYASNSSKNPGPLDSGSVKNEENTSPKAVSVTLDDTKTVYVAVQGQQDNNKFRLTFWDNLFQSSGTFQVDIKEGLAAHEFKTLPMVQNPYNLMYKIADGDTSVFSIETTAPKLSTKVKLDYETTKRYRVVVVADDQQNSCHKSRAQVLINVIDVNDHPPRFGKAQYSASIAENAQKGTLVEQVVATDEDSGENGRITYKIESSTAPDLFKINSNGDVTLNGTLDFETQDSYTLNIKASDNGSPRMSALVMLQISVTDVNEQPSISCVGSCIYTISEAANTGTAVGQLTVNDPDKKANCQLQYSMPAKAAGKFAITNKEITTVAKLDREDSSQYAFYITVRDCGSPPLTDSVRVTITVSDVNDNSPVFPGPYNVSILESESTGSTVVQVKASDADDGANAEIKYALFTGESSNFLINQDDGTITTVSKLDYETKQSYTFTVLARDQGPGSNTGQAQVTVNVVDVNDNAPSFVGEPYVANVKESAGRGTPVIDVNATDSDSGLGGRVKYSIVSGNTGLAFAINEDTGLITVNSALDQETTPSFTLLVQAKDQGLPTLQSQATVTITINDANDNYPVFQGLPYTASVPEDFDTTQPLLTVSATDDDAGRFGEITYSIDSPSSAKQIFNIDSNGNIRVNASLDYETTKEYTFSVAATDGGGLKKTATVNIYVTDVNDNEPRFEKNPYNETVAENMNAGHVVGTVKATDEDSGQRGSVTYSITSGNTGDAFTINAEGKVIALIRLDRETREFYTLTIEGKDGGSPPKSSTTRMEITVLDLNDNTPSFGKSFYSFMIYENNNPNAEIGKFGPATDGDKGANAEIVYTIVSGDPNRDLEYDPSGKLKAKNVLDREITPVYDLVFEARDKGTPPRFVRIAVQVIVLDRNDNGPVFTENPYNCEIDENSAPNSRVCSVSASDDDAGKNGDVTYELVTPSTKFSVDQDDGEIKALVTLDREETPTYTFDIIAKDSGSPSRNSTVTVMVKVLDKNDNEPRFNRSSYSFDVSEDASLNTVVGEVFADDKDEGASGEVVYSITGGNTGSAFSINDTSGQITVKSSLDRESVPSYELTIVAADRGTPSQSSSRKVVITVTDINDNDPVFTADPYQGRIAEDASIGSFIVQVQATDADEGINSRIKYSITSGDSKEDFSIDADSGFITTAAKLDYESKKSYLLTVTASDGGDPKRTDTTHVNITVDNANDNAPTFESDSPVVRVSEAVAIGTNVVKFNATDVDGNKLMFSITAGNIGGTFTIDKDTGIVSTNASLDRETVPRYNMTVNVTDNGGSSDSQDLVVIVTDFNDNAPRFDPSSYSVTITENTAAGLVETVTATDDDEGDNAKITYSIDSTSAEKFVIDSTSGKISSKTPLDYEESPRYEITVTAKDDGTPSLSSTATVVVTVGDLNDNNPNFNRDYSTSLRENTAEGTVIRVEATDPDSGVNGEIEYSITSGDDDGFFTIGKTDGIIKVANPPDREQNPSFTLTIAARNKVPADPSATPTKTTATVTITIDDVNDNAPNIINNVTSFEIQENSPNGTQVIDVDAVDKDVGVNSEIEFEIVGGNIDEAFVIDKTSGLITVNGDIDRETRDSYTLKVRVSDKGSPPLSSEKEFLVNVTDVDDNIPLFTAEPYDASVSEAANVSTFVIKVIASDADAGPNAKLKFSIVSGDDKKHFKIDTESGEIISNAPLDYETVPAYALKVRAEDASHRVETNVQIRLVNINDNSPIFNPARYSESIPENQQQKYEILTLTATDKDAFGGLTYTIVSGNLNSKFTLEPGSGKLRVAGELDRESTDFYNLTVRVTDGGAPARSDTAFVEIHIRDINDNAPKFNTSREQVSVLENSPLGTRVLTVFAEDGDVGLNGDVRYNITKGNKGGLFKIGESSGLLSVDGNIDRETISSFRLEIVAEDHGTPSLKSFPLIVDIEVLDDNDNSPKFTKDRYARDISETSSVGSFVEEVQAIDADIGVNAKVVYSLSTGLGFFRIENETGVISTTAALDRESIPSFIIIVVAKDLGNPSRNSSTTLTVTVLDANDNPPVFDVPSLSANVTEEKPAGQFVTRVVATDADDGANAEIEYKLESNAKQFLHIDPKTGIVSTKFRFDFEAQRNYTFKVIASDKGNPPRSTTATLYINVLDTDDNCPKFNPKEYNLTVEENRPLDMVIVTVYATDVDTVGDERLEYGIRDGNKKDTFRIEPYKGEITSQRFIDREIFEGSKKKEFNLIVRAGNDFCGVNISADQDEIRAEDFSKSIAHVNIIVTDQNDNAPKFLQDSYQYELTDIFTESLLWLNATDPDEGVNAEFDFALAGVTRVGFKRTLLVTATDKGTPRQSSNTTVEVEGKNCEAMTFSVSASGHITVKTLCSFKEANNEGSDLFGKKMTFTCVAEGNTKPEYRWTKNGVPLTDWKDTGLYVINSLRKDDAGLYSCIASSDAGNIVSNPIRIYAREPAKIAVPPKETWAQIGRSAYLSCLAKGDERITYSWKKNGILLISNAVLNFDKPNVIFNEILAADEGDYVCLVRNDYGSDESNPARLQVYAATSVIEMDIVVNNPQVQENCQIFNLTSVVETLNGVVNGSVAVVEFVQPETMCNLTACSFNPCKNQGKCFARGSDFDCQCPRGWGGKRCDIDINECEPCDNGVCTSSSGTCRNNGTCVNRKGSFSCDCPSSINGKLCQFTKDACNSNQCQSGETCYPKETKLGYECLANAQSVSMVYNLGVNRLPFEDWMVYDIAKDIENTIVTSAVKKASQGTQGRRKRREASTPDYSDCSVRIPRYERREATLHLDITLVCKTSPSKTFVCNAMLAERKIQSCTADNDNVITQPETTTPPPISPLRVMVAFIARDSNNKNTHAPDTIGVIKGRDIEKLLRKDGMTVVDIRARIPPKIAKQESDGLSSAVIAGIIIAIVLLILVAVMIFFVFLRTRKGKQVNGQSFSFMTMANRSPVKTALKEKAASVRDLHESEYRGVMNTGYNDENDGVERDTENRGTWFMVKNPEFIQHKMEFMEEIEDAPWYYGRISREKAEDILNENVPAGTYLVRSGQRNTEFYLSVRAPEGGPKVRHIEVDRYEEDFVAVLGNADDAMGFATFGKLIEYLQSTPIHFEGCENDLLLTDYVDRVGITIL